MNLFFFRDLIQEFGFVLINHCADIYYRQETGIPNEESLKDNGEELESIYSSCWFGEYFFKMVIR